MTDFKMSSNRPYLLRAMYEWIVDNQCTPHLLVDVRDNRVKVPREHARDGQIVLNINPSAVGQFHWDNDHIEFSARFGGVARNMWIPISAVLAIYARENGEGMAFTVEAEAAEHDEQDEQNEATPSMGSPAAAEKSDASTPALSSVTSAKSTSHPKSGTSTPESDPPPTPPSGGRSHLKVVK